MDYIKAIMRRITISTKQYDSTNIKSLGIVGGVRSRFSMYIDSIGGEHAVLKLLHEILANSNDESKEGHTDTINIVIDTKNLLLSVEDFGRGIPIAPIEKLKSKSVETLDSILLEIHSGGKFDADAYDFSTGYFGAGTFLCNCLSTEMIIDVHRDNRHVVVRYKQGFKDKVLVHEEDNSGTTGTKVTFKPDIEILFSQDSGCVWEGRLLDKEYLHQMLDSLSHITPNVTFNLNYDGVKTKYLFKGTFTDYLKDLMSTEKKRSMLTSYFAIEDINKELKMSAKIAFTFVHDQLEEKYISFVNGFPTNLNGTHVSGCKKSISRVVTNYLKNNGYIPKNVKYQISGGNIMENVFGLVLCQMQKPLFSNQTKECLISTNYENYISALVYNTFSTWANNNPNEMDKICKLAVLKAKADYAAKEAHEVAMDPTNTKNLIQSKIDLKKFTDCSGNNPKENELFLVEGDSAGGTLGQARDSRTQAFLRLRGKLQNVVNKKAALSAEQEAIVTILGMGFGSKKNIAKLKYHKIILMCDADSDGKHIASLCIAFFYTYFKEIIDAGHLYVAMPPLYGLTFKNKQKIFVLNEELFSAMKINAALFVFNLIDINGKVLPKELFRLFLSKLMDYNKFIDQYSIELNVDPVLLELIVRSFDQLIKGKYKQFTHYGYKVQEKHRSKDNVVFEFDLGYNHAYINIDSKFYNNVYKPIYTRLCDIKLGNVRFQAKQDKRIFSGTLYELNNTVDLLLTNKNVTVTRYKGLGEMGYKELEETCVSPLTRKLIKVTVDDIEKDKYWINSLLNSRPEDIKNRKAFFLSE